MPPTHRSTPARRWLLPLVALAIGVLGSLIYLTVHSIFDNLFVQHMQLQLALLLACVANTDRREVTC